MDVFPTVKKKCQEKSGQNSSFVLNLKKDNVAYRVCKKMFINTLGIGEWSLHHWTKVEVEQPNPNSKIGKRNPQWIEAKNMMHTFFDSLPKMESHYCRSRSKKLYLEPIWQSKAELFLEYRRFSKDQNSKTQHFRQKLLHRYLKN